jgi:hypothetical protein
LSHAAALFALVWFWQGLILLPWTVILLPPLPCIAGIIGTHHHTWLRGGFLREKAEGEISKGLSLCVRTQTCLQLHLEFMTVNLSGFHGSDRCQILFLGSLVLYNYILLELSKQIWYIHRKAYLLSGYMKSIWKWKEGKISLWT